jgi:DNA topoisomerase-1
MIRAGVHFRRASGRAGRPEGGAVSGALAVRAKNGAVARKGGWRRKRRGRGFRYFDARGKEITDKTAIERIESLAVPPAWRDVWISPSSRAKLQAIGVDRAGRRQYLYHPEFRAAQERAKFDKLVRFAERLPDLRKAMAEHMERDALDPERVCAVAVRLINLGWFRVGSERYAKRIEPTGSRH